MNAKLLSLVFLFQSSLFFNGYSLPIKKRSTITISGNISEYIASNSDNNVEISFYEKFNENFILDGEHIKSDIKNNKFKVTIGMYSETGYYSIKNWPIMGLYQNVFLIQSNDSLCLNIKSERDFFFTGRGADKMNYQLWFANQMDAWFKSFRSINDVEKISYNRNKASAMIRNSMDYLSRIKDSMDERTYKLLEVNTISSIRWNCLLDMMSFVSSNDKIYLSALKKEITDLYKSSLDFTITDDFILQNSFLYVRYLFDLSKANAILTTNSSKSNFELFYNLLNKDFKGVLRDKLVLNCVLDLNTKEQSSIDSLPQIIKTVKDKISVEIIKARIQSRMSGAKAFDFTLESIGGEMVRLQDFKGKIIVMDTWFLGCPGCLNLAKEMKPIIEHFRNNKDVVFIGVNVDEDRNKFIAGVKNGVYTSDQTINLYTSGLGYRHPMLKFYQYRSYPNLLLIDKDGFVITSNPVRPLIGENMKDFIKLIEKHQ